MIALSDHFDYKRLFRFVIPSILMMVFTSLYSVVDVYFVSNYAGKTPFAAINLIIPFTMIIGAAGFMLGAGGSAIVSKTMGQGKDEAAKRYFSMIIYVTIGVGILLSILSIVFLKQVSLLLGATEDMLPYCIKYARIILATTPFFMLQNSFQTFLITAERPKLGLRVTVAAGVTNMVLDYLLVGVLKGGVVAAALATALSQFVGGGIPLVYFILNKTSRLKLVKTGIEWGIILNASTNGFSELLSNISMSVVGMIFNLQLLKYAGENGVAAYGVIMYTGFLFVAIFIGYSIGVAPIIGYNYGADNHEELHNVFTKSLKIIALSSITMLALVFLTASPLSKFYVGYDETLLAMTIHGFKLFNISVLILGFNIYASSFFTALGNGMISAIISFCRTFILQLAAILILPIFFGLNGIWAAVDVSECLALMVSIFYWITQKQNYNY